MLLGIPFPSHLDPPAMRSLSLLFIIDELSQTFEEIKSFINTAHTNTFTEDLLSFLSLDHPFPKKGICPDKLCFYSDILLQASKIEDTSLLKELDEMRISILEFRSQVPLPKGRVSSSMEILLSPLDFLKSLHQKLCSFFFTLTPFLYEARTDENILLKLIEYRQMFNEHLGSHAIEKLLQKFFPNGHSHLRAVICEGFTRRGFTSFLAEKEHLIEEIEREMDSSCLSIHN